MTGYLLTYVGLVTFTIGLVTGLTASFARDRERFVQPSHVRIIRPPYNWQAEL